MLRTSTARKPCPQTAQTQQASYDEAHEPIALAVLLSKFARIRLDAVEAGLLSEYAGQYYDVPNRPQSPYLQHENLLIAPTQETRIGLTIPFVLPTALFYSNYLSASQVQSVQVDFGNGQGYQTLVWNQTYTISYPTSGLKTLRYRLTLAGGAVREGHSFLGIKPEPNIAQRYENTEHDYIEVAETATKGGGRASIVFSVKNTTQPRKLRKTFYRGGGL